VEKPNPLPEPPFFTIADGNTQLLTALPDNQFIPGDIQFLSESGEVAVALENGAVVKWQIGEKQISITGQEIEPAVMLSKPRWFIDTYSDPQTGDPIRTMVITLIQVNSTDSLAKSGICTVQMKVEPLNITDPDILNPGDETNYIVKEPPDGNTVRISTTMKNRYYKAWANYFENDLRMSSTDDITWERNHIDRLIIKAYKVTVIDL